MQARGALILFTDSLRHDGHADALYGKMQRMRHPRGLVLVAAFAVLAAMPTASSASVARRSGLHGSVRTGPTEPICTPGTPCTAPAAGVSISFVRNGVTHHARTDALGRYSIRLAPGKYAVLVANARFGYDPHSATVPRSRKATLNIRINTGIG